MVYTFDTSYHVSLLSIKMHRTQAVRALLLVMWRFWVREPSKAPIVSLSKKLFPYCLVLVGYRNGFERDFTIELK